MQSPTRRRALHGAAALLAGVAGCSASQSSGPGDPVGDEESVALDPETYSLRNPGSGPALWFGDRPTVDEDDPGPWRHHDFVTDAERAADVAVADVDGAAGAREFLTATEYDTSTVYVERVEIRACFAQDLCYVRWSATDIETSYTRYYRDADVACEAEARHTVATLIRLPEAFDPSDVSGYGSSRGSAPCERREERLRREGDGR
jgi:hypothetical protein